MKAARNGARENRRLIVFLLAALGTVWTALMLGGYFERRNVQKEAEDDVLRMSQIVAEQTGGLLEEVRIYLGLMDAWLQDNPGADPRTDPRFLRLVDNLREKARFRIDLRLVSEDDGLYYIPSEDTAKPLAVVADREYAKAQKDPATRGFYIAGPVLSRVTGLWGIPISYPLTHHNAGMALIFAAVELPFLDKLYETVRPKPDGAITLIRSDGVILCRAPFDEASMGRDLSDKDLATLLPDGVRMATSPLDGKRRIIASRSLPAYSVMVTVAASEDGTFATWQRAMYVRTAVLVVITAIMMALGFRLRREWLALAASNARAGALNAELGSSAEALRRQLEEKELLVRETNHRVKNHMAQLVSLIGLSGSADTEGVLEGLKARIYGYSVLYDKLSYEADPNGLLDLADYLRDLLATLIELSSDGRPVEQSFSGEALQTPARLCSGLGLILGELVTNSLKHSRCGNEPLRIAVTVEEILLPAEAVRPTRPQAGIRIVYGDNGEGFDFEAVRSSPKGEHIGMILIDTMLSQYGGTISYSREEGSRFEIVV